ncbi:hypothetical protein PHLGIDRAFT_428583 [Phlebiopsis gigantea 11061_1 CR5-6]|uniref:Secreted protein n=1 Tax=Phlebiopsis gigantea (strain 11061_1 CR5-6) TaxID=745531 RepID=A0A0C3NPT2_PHLG1|nr:hypothetical protein PHLGIDRAFT_428583 [Phlebiopsis gigantea 11061_1 CR5-6]
MLHMFLMIGVRLVGLPESVTTIGRRTYSFKGFRKSASVTCAPNPEEMKVRLFPHTCGLARAQVSVAGTSIVLRRNCPCTPQITVHAVVTDQLWAARIHEPLRRPQEPRDTLVAGGYSLQHDIPQPAITSFMYFRCSMSHDLGVMHICMHWTAYSNYLWASNQYRSKTFFRKRTTHTFARIYNSFSFSFRDS